MLSGKITNLAALGPIGLASGLLGSAKGVEVTTGAGAVTILGDGEFVEVIF